METQRATGTRPGPPTFPRPELELQPWNSCHETLGLRSSRCRDRRWLLVAEPVVGAGRHRRQLPQPVRGHDHESAQRHLPVCGREVAQGPPDPHQRALVGHRQGRPGRDLSSPGRNQRGSGQSEQLPRIERPEDRRLLGGGDGQHGAGPGRHERASARVREDHQCRQPAGAPRRGRPPALHRRESDVRHVHLAGREEQRSLRAPSLPGWAGAAEPRLLLRHGRARDEDPQ